MEHKWNTNLLLKTEFVKLWIITNHIECFKNYMSENILLKKFMLVKVTFVLTHTLSSLIGSKLRHGSIYMCQSLYQIADLNRITGLVSLKHGACSRD